MSTNINAQKIAGIFNDSIFTIQNNTDLTKQALLSLSALTTGTTTTYTLPPVSTTILGKTGTLAASYIPYMNDANQVTGSTNITYNGSTLKVGVIAPIYSSAICISSNANNNYLSSSLSIQNTGTGGATGSSILLLEASNKYAGFFRYNNSYTGNIAGTSVALANIAFFANEVSSIFGDGTVCFAGSPILGLVSSTSTNLSFRQDAVGFRIDQMSNIHTTNLNPFTVVGKTRLGTNTAATYMLDVDGDVGIANIGSTLRVKANVTNAMLNDVTLVSGVATVSISGLTTADKAFIQLKTPSGTLASGYSYSCTSGTLTITSETTAGATNTLDNSTVSYFIVRPY